MPISSNTRIAGPFTGTGSVSVYSFDFKVFTEDDLLVVHADTNGAETTLVLNSDYTVSLNADQDNDPGGDITLASNLLSGYTLVITSAIENLQPTDLTNQGGFYPSVITNALDRACIQIQQLQEQVGRSIKVSLTSAINPADYLGEAQQAVTDAQAAQTAAETAQGLAETAQSAAEAAETNLLSWCNELIPSNGANIASATTTDIGAATGQYVQVTGTTTITGLGTCQAGIERVVKFTGALTLTYNATSLILPTSANITTAAGDVARFRSLGSGNWQCVGYQRADGSALVSTGSQHGQCRLAKSGSNLMLMPYNGNKLVINGTAQTIPAAGVSLAPPATSGTTYYIYAYMNSGTMTLEYSTTTHDTDSTTGVEIKSGDATRTLVGMARTDTSAWMDSVTKRYVRTWFNDVGVSLYANYGSNQSVGTSPWVTLNANLNLTVLTWAGENIDFESNGAASDNTASAFTMYLAAGYDGSAYGPTMGRLAFASDLFVLSAFGTVSATEGFHTVTALAGITGGSAPYFYGGYMSTKATTGGRP